MSMEALKNRATMHLHLFDKHSYAITFANSIKKRKYLCQGVFICGPTCTTKCHFFISFLESATKCAFRHSTIIRSKSCKVYKF